MPAPLTTPALLQLPPDDRILFDQMLTTDRSVRLLHPLLDLLTEPEDQRESLGERLARLLTALSEALKDNHAQQVEGAARLDGLTAALTSGSFAGECEILL